jgi:methyl-accepting chemotaxis protein
LRNLPIFQKLMLSFGCIILVFCAVVAVVFGNLMHIDALAAKRVASQRFVNQINAATITMVDLSGQVRGYMLTQDPDYAKGVAKDHGIVNDQMRSLQTMAHTPQQMNGLDDMATAIHGYTPQAGDPEIQFARNPATLGQALGIMRGGIGKKWMNAFKASARTLLAQEAADETMLSQSQSNAIHFSQILLLLGGAIALAAAAAFGWLLSRQIAFPVRAMTTLMKRLAAGDTTIVIRESGRRDEIGGMAQAVQMFKAAGIEKLRLEAAAQILTKTVEADRVRAEAERLEVTRQQAFVVESLASGLEKLSRGDLLSRLTTPFVPEYEKLRGDFNNAIEKLQNTLQSIAANAQAVRAGATEITQASDDLSRRTEQQAASLEQTAAALDQITATVRKTAQGAIEAHQVVNTAKADAERSGTVVNDTVAAMSGIENSSKQISNIIGVIDEIAFQTNLLALNAGIEAARAGDAGRGFAVVATEVRALAQRSADAAKEIKALISASRTQVESGVNLVGETGRALTRIVDHVNRLTLLVSEIAGAAQEQASGMAEVNIAVNQMDQVTQQNAAMVEQSTAASHALASESEDLARLVAQFRIGPATQASAPRRATEISSRPAPKRDSANAGRAIAIAHNDL